MPRNFELDLLKSREQDAFSRKQAAFQRYSAARDRASEAYDEMQSAWEARCRAREIMNQEYEAMQSASSHYREVWDEYGQIRDYNSARIDALRSEADREHQEMISCFERASNAYEYGDKLEAKYASEEGHGHKDRRNELNEEVQSLVREIKEAKQRAEWRASKTDSSAFHSAKAEFERAKAYHERLQARFKELKAERDWLKAEFDSAHAEHMRLKNEFQSKLGQVKSAKRESDRRAVEKVNMALVKSKPFYLGSIFGQDAKVVPRRDGSGKTDVYFAGLSAAGDGLGHGHAVIDSDGNVTYLRDAWQDHKDYLINDHGGPTHK